MEVKARGRAISATFPFNAIAVAPCPPLGQAITLQSMQTRPLTNIKGKVIYASHGRALPGQRQHMNLLA